MEFKIICCVLIGILFVIALSFIIMLQHAKARLTHLERRYNKLLQGNSVASMETLILKRFAEVDMLKKSLRSVADALNAIGDACENSIQKVGIEKYDAFEDIGGNLSFAIALLNRNYSGFIINVIHSKEGCYSYLKEISAGKPVTELTKEEVKALDIALKS